MCVNTRENSLGSFGESPSPHTPTTIPARLHLEGLPTRTLPASPGHWTHPSSRAAPHTSLQGLRTDSVSVLFFEAVLTQSPVLRPRGPLL